MEIQSETNLNQFRKSFKMPLTFFLSVRVKLIPPSQIKFCVPEYRIFRKDRNACGIALLFYGNQYLNCKVLNKYPTRQDLEILVLELKLSKTN